MPSSLLQFDADGFFCCMWSTYMCSHSMLFEECDVTSTLQYLYVLSCRSVPDFAFVRIPIESPRRLAGFLVPWKDVITTFPSRSKPSQGNRDISPTMKDRPVRDLPVSGNLTAVRQGKEMRTKLTMRTEASAKIDCP